MTHLLLVLLVLVAAGSGVLVTSVLMKVLGAIKRNSGWTVHPREFDASKDVTTVLPVPLGASTCCHRWVVASEQKLTAPHQERLAVIMKCDLCGSIDKTVQAIGPPPPPPVIPTPKSECRHRWDREKTVTLDSAYEQMTKAEQKVPHTQFMKKASQLDATTIEPWMFRKTYVSIRVCTLCGLVEKIIASNYRDGDEVEQEIDEAFEALQVKRRA
jgi:hypothetical protein